VQSKAVQDREKALLGSAYRDNDLIFAMPNGDPVKLPTFAKAFDRTVKRAGVERRTLKHLRQTNCSLLSEAGVPIEVVAKRLGHSSTKTTERYYLEVTKRRDVAAAEAFDKLMG
jgi:integrase